MNKNINICPSLSIATALLFATMFVSCIKAEIEAPIVSSDKEISFKTSNGNWNPLTKSGYDSESRMLLAENQDENSSFSLGLTVTDGIETPWSNTKETKGVQITAINSFDVAGYMYKNSTVQNGSLFFADQVLDGFTEETYYWPSFGTMDFIAVYPSGTVEGGVQNIADPNGKLQSFTYQIPESIAEQEDIMIAVTKDMDCKTGGQVPLTFKHLMAAVQFKVGKMVATRINSLTISGVKGGEVTMTYDSANDRWNYAASSDNVSYSPIYEVAGGNPNIDTYGMAEGNYITSNENGMVMFVMPQTLAGATISINYTEQITGTTHNYPAVTLPTHTWEAGKTMTYIINIVAETLQITIPTPPDADAHYVRVDMQYNLSGLNSYAGQGITISNIKADARWLDDGSNTASADKQSIFIKTSLTPMQEQGYFTDQLWEVRYRVSNNGTKTYTVGSEDGPELVTANILGSENLTLANGSSGTLYLFLDENDGTTNRNGVLEVTADVTQNRVTRSVILGSGAFKQLCPSWNTAGLGVERFENNDTYPFGFSYNRVVTYTNTQAETYEDIVAALGQWAGNVYKFILWLFGAYADEVIPDTDGMADGFVDVGKDDVDGDYIKTITLNYAALNSVNALTNVDDGLYNTRALYNYTGATDIEELENEFDETLGNSWTKTETVSAPNPVDYAAFIALTSNRMREVHTIITSSEGTNTTEQAILHKINEGDATNGVNETGEDIIEWFLPSVNQAMTLIETGTGTESTPISPLNGTYWTSTAGIDPDSGTNGYAYSYVFSNNVYSSNSASQDRTSKIKVRAVRKK